MISVDSCTTLFHHIVLASSSKDLKGSSPKFDRNSKTLLEAAPRGLLLYLFSCTYFANDNNECHLSHYCFDSLYKSILLFGFFHQVLYIPIYVFIYIHTHYTKIYITVHQRGRFRVILARRDNWG